MIIYDGNIMCILVLPLKYYSPLVVDSYTAESLYKAN